MKTLEISTAILAFAMCSHGQIDPHTSAPAGVLVNIGQPITIPFQCTEDDMQWAGLSCSEQDPCPIYFEVAAAESLGDRIFAAGNLHSETVTLYSVLLGSDDAGKTWRELHNRIRGAGLDHIQFLDFASGWISGEALFPLPQDPFLLLTADGGKTWQRQLVLSEMGPGSIQQFLFTSRDAGLLVIDRGEGSEAERYALYESPDGGKSWNVKELSQKPIRLTRTVESEKDWRVRANSSSRSFQIEHRQGERWTAAASFAVSAGACRPEPLNPTVPEDARPESRTPPSPVKPLRN
ncbi:MAG: hypothetical protein JO323_03425 [Acidobacteriia bacterium]|nr:hypothetical protein [Terriglobia bacterium]